jgi:hypothetical protein
VVTVVAVVGGTLVSSRKSLAQVVSLSQQAELPVSAITAVASDGSTAVVGSDDANSLTGSASVYTRAGTTWSLQQTLVASDGNSGDLFGISVSLSGNTLAIGASGRGSGAGAVYVFVTSGGTWSQQAVLVALQGVAGDGFGASVALDDGTLLVGAYGVASQAGAAYVFTGSGNAWFQRQKLTASGGVASDLFGFSVALSGSTALVGAYGAANQAGAAYVFTGSGSSWSQQQKLQASDASSTGQFGFSVALGGTAALIGANGSAHGGTGAAYVFGSQGGSWTQQKELVAAGGSAGDAFGASVGLAGTLALVGAPNVGQTGATYLFEGSGSSWTQHQTIIPTDAPTGFGTTLALTTNAAVIGANDAAYVYAAAAVPAPAMGPRGRIALAALLLGVALATRMRKRQPLVGEAGFPQPMASSRALLNLDGGKQRPARPLSRPRRTWS